MAEVANMPSAATAPPATSIADKTASQNENFDDDKNAANTKDSRLNSHHHDSEYDTASDDGGDDDYDDEDDESLGADGEEDESENGSVGFDSERQRGDGQEQSDYSKKVDEDRSNPQYIPKKGNFYEHDDRTLDEPEAGEGKTDEAIEGEQTKSSTPNHSQASKTMKKWQPASAVDRWSHDRFDESEQAPKSRQELVSAYGYDIRSEDGPPRPRRRRRYGRGPNKYDRHWEDENAYIKSNANPQRKPRPEDFPALGDRERKAAARKSHSFREEKENRYNRDNERTTTTFNRGTNLSQRDGRIEKRNSSGKSFRASRPTLEFRNQNKNRFINEAQQSVPSSTSRKFEKNETERGINSKIQLDKINSSSSNATKLVPPIAVVQMDMKDFIPNQLIGDVTDKLANLGGRQVIPTQAQLAAQLQLQNRNDPSHVGSVQMHSIISQNQPNLQQQSQQQQQQTSSSIQQQNSEANRSKRYSSLRQRSQNDTVTSGPQSTIVDAHTLTQQIQLHDHHQATAAHPTQQHVILQDQHLLQANLMQLYHTQENLQAQMQGVTIQGLTAAGHQQKPQYQNVQAQYQAAAAAAAAATAPSPAAYYTPTAADFTSAPQPPTVPSQYPQQQATAYIQPQPTNNPMTTYNPQPQASGTAPAALSYVQTQAATPGTAPYPNYAGYQNFNTVGGTTYFVPQQPTAPRPAVLPQRRPTNAIPILAPPNDKKALRTNEDDSNKSSISDTADNIDHILDNMFVQRPPYQPPTRKSSSPQTTATESTSTETAMVTQQQLQSANENNPQVVSTQRATISFATNITDNSSSDARLEDAVKNMTLNDDQKIIEPIQQTTASVNTLSTTPSTVAATAEASMVVSSPAQETTAAESG